MSFSITIRLNTSPTERTPWLGRHPYFPSMTRASPTNLSDSVPTSLAWSAPPGRTIILSCGAHECASSSTLSRSSQRSNEGKRPSTSHSRCVQSDHGTTHPALSSASRQFLSDNSLTAVAARG